MKYCHRIAYILPILRVRVVLLSRFSDDIRVDKDLVWVRDRTIARLLEANCWFPIWLSWLLLLIFILVIDVACEGCLRSLTFSQLGCHWVVLLYATLDDGKVELSFSEDSDGILPISISS